MKTATTTTPETMKTLQDIKNDFRVHSVSDERNNGDGYFVYLKGGFKDYAFDPFEAVSTIHEQTIKLLIERFRGVRPIGYEI
ncbi:MAG: hypothetical protein IH843_06245 [Thaumarchaeota archaeon]|nr:hypothetical protein [Nitrososphaerota archaeon]